MKTDPKKSPVVATKKPAIPSTAVNASRVTPPATLVPGITPPVVAAPGTVISAAPTPPMSRVGTIAGDTGGIVSSDKSPVVAMAPPGLGMSAAGLSTSIPAGAGFGSAAGLSTSMPTVAGFGGSLADFGSGLGAVSGLSSSFGSLTGSPSFRWALRRPR